MAGPTASGKSALALALAQHIGGEIINADAAQCYREVRILSARPGAYEQARARHHLYGWLSAEEGSCAGGWLEQAQKIAAQCREAGKIPILVGGAGLYISCFDQGLASIPPVPPAVRAAVRERMESLGVAACHRELQRIDSPLAARVAATDRQRIARGLEVWQATAKPLSRWQQEAQEAQKTAPPANHLRLLLTPPRPHLYQRCETRFDAMMEQGALAEVASLRAGGGEIAPTLRRLHGVAPLQAHLNGGCSLEQAVSAAKQQTRNYAKRQMTWARHRLRHWHSLEAEDEEESLERALSLCY